MTVVMTTPCFLLSAGNRVKYLHSSITDQDEFLNAWNFVAEYCFEARCVLCRTDCQFHFAPNHFDRCTILFRDSFQNLVHVYIPYLFCLFSASAGFVVCNLIIAYPVRKSKREKRRMMTCFVENMSIFVESSIGLTHYRTLCCNPSVSGLK